MTPQEMRLLYDYNAWANHRSVDAAASRLRVPSTFERYISSGRGAHSR